MSAHTAVVRRRRAMKMVAALIMGRAIRPRPAGVKTDEAISSSRSNHTPQPLGDLGKHVAEQQQRRRPDQRRYEIGDLKLPVWHLEYSGRQRHRGPQRSKKPPDENARHAP